MRNQAFRFAFVRSIPVLMGYSTMGAAFGILLNKAGFSPWWSIPMSLTILSGSLQFAAVGMMQMQLGFWETAVMSLLINIRYCVYGLSLIEPFREAGWRKYYLIFTLTDETFALEVQDKRPKKIPREKFMFYLAALNHSYWIAGCVAGAFAGNYLTFDTRGIEFAMTALFLVILTEQCMERNNRIPAWIGAGATILAGIVFGKNNMLLPGMILMILLLLGLQSKLEKNDGQ